VFGVASHALPHVRTFLGGLDAVEAASLPEPFGYRLSLRGNGRRAELLCYMHGSAHDVWTFDAWAEDAWLHAAFTPSFVHAGSAESVLRTATGTRTVEAVAENGAVAQWREIADLATGVRAAPRYDIDTVVADAEFTVQVADAAADVIRKAEK
jgi:myo-inositol 2-dehydrogenase / D-chiro-inositol 1-dehydrogenase